VSSALKRLPRPGRHGREQLVHTLLGHFGPSRVEMTSVAKSRRTVATSADRVATLVASARSPSSSRLASGCVRIRPLIGRHGSLSAAVCVRHPAAMCRSRPLPGRATSTAWSAEQAVRQQDGADERGGASMARELPVLRAPTPCLVPGSGSRHDRAHRHGGASVAALTLMSGWLH
jgi:hypothetical protein